MGYKKGQLSVDFYVSLIVFLGLMGYIAFQLFEITPVTSTNTQEESIRIEAYQISEILANDVGHPTDWETKSLSEIKRIGLSDSSKSLTNYLSRAKLDRLRTICATDGYQAVRDKLDVKDEMSITFVEHALPTDVTWVCKSAVPTSKEISFNISRTVSIDGIAFGELIIEVWKI